MKHYVILMYARLLNILLKIISVTDTTLKIRFLPGFNKLRLFNANARAYLQFTMAIKRVPAYRDFLNKNGFKKPAFLRYVDLTQIPITTKQNYVNQYKLNERCTNGIIPDKGVIIDESSGSSGTATNWVRGFKERKENMRLIKFGITNLFGDEPVFVINAFALGAWATGVNVTMSCLAFSKIKSTGPDKTKIINTLQYFGNKHKYLIAGYPPFLKLLTDTAAINWLDYNVSMIFGGEPMSEGMRNHMLKKGIKNIYSSFGASDLELNISSENDFTISLRKLLNENKSLAQRILKYQGAIPMVFQYNPGDFLIENNDKGELLFTICRPGYTSPKIRYNIYDKGHTLSMKVLKDILTELGLLQNIVLPKVDLPLLFHYGRADMTVAFFGANISPNDIQETIFNIPELAAVVNSYCLNTIENNNADKLLTVSIEFMEGKSKDLLSDKMLNDIFFNKLADINQDFKATLAMAHDTSMPRLVFYDFYTGPFVKNDIKIKSNYLM